MSVYIVARVIQLQLVTIRVKWTKIESVQVDVQPTPPCREAGRGAESKSGMRRPKGGLFEYFVCGKGQWSKFIRAHLNSGRSGEVSLFTVVHSRKSKLTKDLSVCQH